MNDTKQQSRQASLANNWLYWLLCLSPFVKELVLGSSCLDTFEPEPYAGPSSSGTSATAARIEN